jgi:hypothetical protein
MQWTDVVGHLNLSAVFTHSVLKLELIGLMTHLQEGNLCYCNTHAKASIDNYLELHCVLQHLHLTL